MLKFKALFKRSQKTLRGRHIGPEFRATTAVENSAQKQKHGRSASIISSVCVDRETNVFAYQKLNELTMEEQDEITRLRNEIQKREELLSELAAENESLKSLMQTLPQVSPLASLC